jgi:hypothetical protein
VGGLSDRDRLDIEWTCAHLMHRFTHLLDAREYDALAPLFARDGVLYRPSAPDEAISGRDTILAAYKARAGGKATQHFITNASVTVDNAAEAHGVCSILLYTAAPGDGSPGPLKADPMQSLGYYRDRFVFEDGAWKFLERRGSVSMTAG